MASYPSRFIKWPVAPPWWTKNQSVPWNWSPASSSSTWSVVFRMWRSAVILRATPPKHCPAMTSLWRHGPPYLETWSNLAWTSFVCTTVKRNSPLIGWERNDVIMTAKRNWKHVIFAGALWRITSSIVELLSEVSWIPRSDLVYLRYFFPFTSGYRLLYRIFWATCLFVEWFREIERDRDHVKK